MRKIIAALQVSLDGLIEGANEDIDWANSREDPFDIVGNVDTFILGARMYPGYEQYWQAVRDTPRGVLPFTGRPATDGEIEYAAFACRTPHVVVSSKLQAVSWTNTRIVRDLEDVRRLKEAPGAGIVHLPPSGTAQQMTGAVRRCSRSGAEAGWSCKSA